jgi:hypothetical protein
MSSIPLPVHHPNIIIPSMPGSSKLVSSPQDSPPKPCIHLSSPPYVLHAQPHPILLDFITRIIFLLGVQNIKLFIMQFSPLPCSLVPLRPKHSLQHSILKHPQPALLPSIWATMSHTHTTQ